MFNFSADNGRNMRPDMDKITISFNRFRVLRSLAHAAQQQTAPSPRVIRLCKELDKLEIDELVGEITILAPSVVCEENNNV